MNNQKKTRPKKAKIKQALLFLLITLPVLAASFLIFALLYSSVDLSTSLLDPLSVAAAGFGCFFSAFLISKRTKKHGMVYGAATGFAVFIAVFFAGLIFGASISFKAIYKLVILTSSGALGGSLGILGTDKQRIPKKVKI